MFHTIRSGALAVALVACICCDLKAMAPPVEPTQEALKAECDRLDRELYHGIQNALSVTDIKALLEKVNRMEELILKCYPASEAVYRKATSPLMRADFEAIIKMSDADQRNAFEAIRANRYATDDFKRGNKAEAVKAVESARVELKNLFGEKSNYYMLATDNMLYGMLELQMGEKALPLALAHVELKVKCLGELHPGTANAYEFAARAEIMGKKWIDAARHAGSAINIRQKTNVPAISCYALEQLYIIIQVELGELDKAKSLLTTFQLARSELIKEKDIVRLETFYVIVRLEEQSGRDASSQVAEEQGLKLMVELFPRNDPRILGSVQHLRSNLIRQNKREAVMTLEREWGLSSISVPMK